MPFRTWCLGLRDVLTLLVKQLPRKAAAEDIIYEKEAHRHMLRFLVEFAAELAKCQTE
jgi:hypothetical protein